MAKKTTVQLLMQGSTVVAEDLDGKWLRFFKVDKTYQSRMVNFLIVHRYQVTKECAAAFPFLSTFAEK